MTDHTRPTIEPDARRVDEWAAIIRRSWDDAPEATLTATSRTAARDLIHHAEREWRAGHRPGSLTFTGMPPLLNNAQPVTRLIDATSSSDDIKATLECMGEGERGALVGICAAILAVEAATRYPLRWVAGAPIDEPIPYVPVADEPVGERFSVSGHRGSPHDCPHPQCSAARR
jgi:hypothetical protein